MNNDISQNTNNAVQTNPAADPLQKYNKLYIIFAAILGIALFIESFNLVGAIIGIAIGLGIAWFIISFIAMSKVMKLNFTKYPVPKGITKQELLEALVSNLETSDIKISKGLLGISINYKNQTAHTIHLDEEKNFYTISSKMSYKSKAKSGFQVNSKKLYRYTVQALPVIKNMVDSAAQSNSKH